ncbi:MAG: hypothetical protein HKO05_00205, partial [Erythrobacter sp.]|nr:hypothetical protein [Erythrobacter sp.]
MADEIDTEMVEHTSPRQIGRGRKLAIWLGIALGTLLLLVAALLLGLNTGPGKKFVIDQIEGLEFENGLEIEIGGIEGS